MPGPTTFEELRAALERERGRTLAARVATIDRASGDLLGILEQLQATLADPAALAANNQAATGNLDLALEHARAIREALT